MGYGMKYTKGGFPFKTDEKEKLTIKNVDLPDLRGTEEKGEKVDLTKKTGLGPRAEKKEVEKKNRDSSTDMSAVPTFSDHMDRGLMEKKTLKAKKSTTTAHGQLNDADIEYKADLKLLKGNKLKDLRSSDKNVDLDKGTNIPVRKKGLGPRTSFGGSKNPELR